MLNDLLMVNLLLTEAIQTEHCQNVHIKIVNHETDVAQAASCLNNLPFKLPPQNQIDEDLRDFFESFEVYISRAQA